MFGMLNPELIAGIYFSAFRRSLTLDFFESPKGAPLYFVCRLSSPRRAISQLLPPIQLNESRIPNYSLQFKTNHFRIPFFWPFPLFVLFEA